MSTSPGLVSGEAVALDVRIARISSRTLAFAIDAIVAVILFIIAAFLAAVTLAVLAANGVPVDSALVAGVYVSLIIVVLIGYPVAFATLTSGRSVGKFAFGLRVVRDDGGPITFRHALTRGLVGFAVEWPGMALPGVTWLAAIATMIVNPQGKRLGDLAAGTIVVHERSPDAWGWRPTMPAPLTGWAPLLDLTALPDDLALTVRHYLARNRQLREPYRSDLGRALAAEVAGFVTPPPPAHTPGWAYLAAVLAERHRRETAKLVHRRTIAARVWLPTPIPAAWPAAVARTSVR